MANFTGTTPVSVPAAAVFDYLSDIGNLPRYFARMTSAKPAESEAIHTTARMPDGTEVEGEAWFRVDEGAQRIAWGSQGPNDYSGYVDVHPTGDTCEVEVHITTSRVPAGASEVEDGIAETLDAIKAQVEGGPGTVSDGGR